MVGECIRKIRVDVTKGELGPQLILPEIQVPMINLLKDILWHYVIDGRALSAQRLGQARIIETLFAALCVVGDERFAKGEQGELTDKHSTRFKEAQHLFPLFYLRKLAGVNQQMKSLQGRLQMSLLD